MPKRLNLIGKKFTRLRVLADAGIEKNSGHSCWRCICDCGKIVIRRGTSLTTGKTQSCGCLNSEKISKRLIKHGKSQSPEYRAWYGAHQRCYNPNTVNYKQYGGRGITVCDRWNRQNGVEGLFNFISDMGLRPSPKYSLERKNVNGPYDKENCIWATIREQLRNRRKMIALENHTDEELIAEIKRRKLNISGG